MGLVAGTSCGLALMEAREQITPIIITDLDKGSV
jgi:hypothetical protein